ASDPREHAGEIGTREVAGFRADFDAPFGAQSPRHLGEQLRAAGKEDEVHAARGEHLGECGTEAFRGTRNDGPGAVAGNERLAHLALHFHRRTTRSRSPDASAPTHHGSHSSRRASEVKHVLFWTRRLDAFLSFRLSSPLAPSPCAAKMRPVNPLLKLFVKGHVWLYQASGGRLGSTMQGRKILLLTTVGNKSGRARTVPVVPFFHAGETYVIASMGGAPQHPAWYKNLRANPEVGVQLGPDTWRARAVV